MSAVMCVYHSKISDVLNFNQNNSGKVGHIGEFQCGGETLPKEFKSIKDPTAPENEDAIALILTEIGWDKQADSKLYLRGVALSKGKGILNYAIHSPDKPADCEISFAMHDHENGNKFYKCFWFICTYD